MGRDPRSAIIWALAIVAICAYLGGCGGSDPGHFTGGGGHNPPPGGGTAKIVGIVVNAVNPALRVAGAEVRFGEEIQTTDAAGAFNFAEVAEGGVVLSVSFPGTDAYHPMQLTVDTVAHKTTRVVVAAVPISVTAPDAVSLTPASAQVDVGGQVQFTAVVTALGLVSSAKPSFVLSGGVGNVTASGLFTSTEEGQGELTAIAGAASDSSTISVVAPMPPQLGTLSVSPNSLPAEGGPVRVSIPARDGDGVDSVVAEIEYPNTSVATQDLVLETGTRRDGSWATVLSIPANSNPIDAQGFQLPQTYSVRVTATDEEGHSTQSAWADISVAGLEPPPNPP